MLSTSREIFGTRNKYKERDGIETAVIPPLMHSAGAWMERRMVHRRIERIVSDISCRVTSLFSSYESYESHRQIVYYITQRSLKPLPSRSGSHEIHDIICITSSFQWLIAAIDQLAYSPNSYIS